MHYIIVTRGLPASGKTTWARQWKAQSEDRIILSIREMRKNLCLEIENVQDENIRDKIADLGTIIIKDVLTNAMNMNLDICLDDYNLDTQTINVIQGIINWNNQKDKKDKNVYGEIQQDYQLIIKDFFVSLDECIKRDSLRKDKIGEYAIRQMFNEHRETIQSALTDKIKAMKPKVDATLPMCMICDLDNTLVYQDESPVYSSIMIVNSYISKIESSRGDKVVILTQRDNSQESVSKTRELLYKLFPEISQDNFLLLTTIEGEKMKDGMTQAEEILKERLFNAHVLGKFNVDFVLEDSQSCVQMYRQKGLEVLQVNDGCF